MTSELVNLPEDSGTLKAMVRSLALERDRERQRAEESKRQTEELRVEMLRLQLELERFRKWYYSPRADRLASGGELAQMLLAFAEEVGRKPVHPEDIPPAAEPADEPRRLRRRAGRRNLAHFENLPVTTHVYELSVEERACPACERNGSGARIEAAAKPEAPVDKGLAGPGLLAYIVTSKFSDYLPLYRLEDIFERQGFEISRATQSIWCGDVAGLAEPLYGLMAGRVRGSHVVPTDDTIMPMLAKGKTANARMWVYVGDEAGPYNVFDFTLNRGRDGPKYFLQDYGQILLADAYGGYNGVVAGNGITRAGCWAHARRKIVEAEMAAPEIAREAVALVRALYAVEHRAKELPAAGRLDLRLAESAPVLAELKQRLVAWKERLLPKHPMAEAVNYALGQWEQLTVFCSDGAVPIDNNVSEREMKRVVLNRKNSLFVGNTRGGRTAAILASLTSSCRRHGVDPQLYLTQLLVNLPEARLSDLPAWLPDEWKRRQSARPV